MIQHVHSKECEITNEQELRDTLVFADLIAARFPSGRCRTLWRRPLEELQGPPYQIRTVDLSVRTRAEYNRLQKLVDRLKHQD